MNKKTMAMAAASLLMAVTAHAAPFQNGSFETPGFSGGPNLRTFGAGSGALSGWIVTGASIDYLNSNYWQAQNGTYSLDLSGGDAGGVEQTFDTVVGHTYTVRFALAGNPDPAGPSEKTLRVQAIGASPNEYTFDRLSGDSGTNMRWSMHTYMFTATSTLTTLSFSSLNPGAYGPALDNVSVTDETLKTVPTLSQWALVGLAGLLGMLAMRGRRLASRR